MRMPFSFSRMWREHKVFLILILAFLILRVFFLTQPLYGDEINWSRFYCTEQGWFTDQNAHPNLSGWPTIVSCAVLGVHVWAIRLPFLLLFFANTILIYLLCLRFLSKRVGIIAAALMLLSPWELMASLQASQEGVFLSFFYILSFYLLLRYAESGKKGWLVLAGVSWGFGLMCKLSAFALGMAGALFILALPFIHLAGNKGKKQWKQAFRQIFPAAAFVLLGLLVITAYFSMIAFHGTYPADEFRRIRQTLFFSASDAIQVPFASFILMIIILTPLNLALLLLEILPSVRKRDPVPKSDSGSKVGASLHSLFSPTYLALWLWICVPLFLYIFIIRQNGFERYLIVIFPAIAVMNAITLVRLFPGAGPKRHAAASGPLLAFVLFILLAAAAAFLTTTAYPVRPYYSPLANLQGVVSNGLMLFTSDLGPVYYLSLPLLFTLFALCAILALAWLVWKRPVLLLLLLSTGVFYSVYLQEQQLFSLGTPRPYDSAPVVEHILLNAESNTRYVYIGNFFIEAPLRLLGLDVFKTLPLPGELKNAYDAITSFEQKTILIESKNSTFEKFGGVLLYRSDASFEELATNLRQHPAIVLFEDVPPLPQDNPLKRYLATCTLQEPSSPMVTTVLFSYDCRHATP